MPDASPSLLLAGCGKMGSALLSGWLRAGIPASGITVADPAGCGMKGIASYPALSALPARFQSDIVLLAVKPQKMHEALAQLPAFLKQTGPLYISIAAGKTLAFFAQQLGQDAAVVRAMPNTPALIGRGVTALCANGEVTPRQKRDAELLLQAVGSVVWLAEEEKLHAVTALSGSGPAYVFYFLEALVAAGVKLGLDEAVAKQLAIETVEGSAALAGRTGELLEQLRINVTSPGGTTEAALKVAMQDNAFAGLIERMLAAAAKRSAELSA
jgi:pyrroline-5-carboxylate reductase